MEMFMSQNGEWDLGGEVWSYSQKDPQLTLQELLGETCGQLELKTSPTAANTTAYGSNGNNEKISDIVDLLDWVSSPQSDSPTATSPIRVPDQEYLLADANLNWDDMGGDLFEDWINDKVDSVPLLDDDVMDDNLLLEDLPGTLDPVEVLDVMIASVVSTAPSSPACVVPEVLTPPSTVESICMETAEDCCTSSSSDVGSYLSQPSSPEDSSTGGGPIRARDCRKRKVCKDKPYLVEFDDDEHFDEDSSPSPPAKTKRKAGAKSGRGDRKTRKRDQNKSAANRYRQKKKAEVEVMCQEEEEIIKKNKKLRDRVAELSKEAKYLKNLMRDVLKAKGVLK
jgi:hypothetical protein